MILFINYLIIFVHKRKVSEVTLTSIRVSPNLMQIATQDSLRTKYR